MNLSKESQNQECVENIHQQTNQRIYDRNIPSELLQPYLDVRPVSTKYSYMPVVDPRREIKTRLQQIPTYNQHAVFNPGNTNGPWSGFASSINKESELRNQIYALQKCSQSVYVPSSKSDLYQYSFHSNNINTHGKNNYGTNSHSLLFQNEVFEKFNPNPAPNVIGSAMFHNATRAQVKDLTDQKPLC